jgi:hypothetical protein
LSVEATRDRLEEVYAAIQRLRAAGVIRPEPTSVQRAYRAKAQKDTATGARYVIGLLRRAAKDPAQIPFVRNAQEQATRDDIAVICEAIADALEGKE